jgi:hypothetical protein
MKPPLPIAACAASERSPPPRGHHGRQRPLGRAAPPARAVGHRAGARAVNLCIDFCLDRASQALTLFAFSSENWGRPQDEVGALMKLFMAALDREVDELHRRGVRLRFIGERDRFSVSIRERMDAAEAQTRANGRRCSCRIAASYGGRWDIAQAARELAADVAAGRWRPTPSTRPRWAHAVPGRPAAAGPVHPHRRRPSHQQFPALAARLHRTVVHRDTVAGARCGDTAARA